MRMSSTVLTMAVVAFVQALVLRNKISAKRQGCHWHSLPLFSSERAKARSGIRMGDSVCGDSWTHTCAHDVAPTARHQYPIQAAIFFRQYS